MGLKRGGGVMPYMIGGAAALGKCGRGNVFVLAALKLLPGWEWV